MGDVKQLPPVEVLGNGLHERGEWEIDDKDVNVADYSVRGLNTYALRAAFHLSAAGSEGRKLALEEDAISRFVVAYEPPSNESRVYTNPDAMGVGLNRLFVRESSPWFFGGGGVFKFEHGSLSALGPIELDGAASNDFLEILGWDDEHDDEQIAAYSVLNGLGMEGWNNGVVHYLGAFGDSTAANGWYMAKAFTSDNPIMAAYMKLATTRLDTVGKADVDGVEGILLAFAPAGENVEQDEQMMPILAGAMGILQGPNKEQEDFARLLLIGGHKFNVLQRAFYRESGMKPVEENDRSRGRGKDDAEQPDAAEAQKSLFQLLTERRRAIALGQPVGEIDAAINQEKLQQVRAICFQLETVLNSINEGNLTVDQQQFLIRMAEEVNKVRDMLPEAIAPQPARRRPPPTRRRVPPPATRTPPPTGGYIPPPV